MRMVVSTVDNNQQKTDQTAKGALPLSHKCQMLQERQKSQGNTNTQAQRQEYAKYMRVCEVVYMYLPLLTKRLKGRRSEKKYLI